MEKVKAKAKVLARQKYQEVVLYLRTILCNHQNILATYSQGF